MDALGHLKLAVGYNSGEFVRVEDFGGTVFYGAGGRSWIVTRDPMALCYQPLRRSLWLSHHHYAGPCVSPWTVPGQADSWARALTLIDFNVRFIGGWRNFVALAPAIPPSKFGTCTAVVVRGLFRPRPGGSYYAYDFSSHPGDDGFDEANFRTGPGDPEFHDRHALLAAARIIYGKRGIATGFLMLTNSEQVYIDGHPIDWNSVYEQDVYAGKLANAAALFGGVIYVDSARHAGRMYQGRWHDVWDGGLYCGRGRPIPAPVLGRVIHLIRERSGRPDLAFIGEGADPRFAGDEYPGATRYRTEMGLTGGIVHSSDKSEHDIYWLTDSQRGTSFPVGFRIVDDNDGGADWAWVLGATDRVQKHQAPFARVPVYTNSMPLVPMCGTNYHEALLRPQYWWDFGHPDSLWFRWRWNEIMAEASFPE